MEKLTTAVIKFYLSDLVGKILPQDFRDTCTTLVAEEYIENGTSELMASRMAATETSAFPDCACNLETSENLISVIRILRNRRMHPEKSLPLVPIMQKVKRQLAGHELYNRLQRYILTEKELRENRFPRPDGTGNAKFYHSERINKEYFANDARRCVRCSNNTLQTTSCSYHWAKLIGYQCGNGFEQHYQCCNGKVNSIGCTIAPDHVHHNNKFNTSGYKTTVLYPMSHMHLQVFSLDCELIYTTAGMEVAQVTLINSECDVVYETFVKPDNQILDYNTRFSGIQESDLKNVNTTLRDVQDQLLQYISANTILVGHSLECDLRSLKIVHSNVVDTSVLFARLLGNSYKTGLKKLAQDYLKMKIQDNSDGHDSKEDAIAAMKLVHYQLQQEAIENYYTSYKLRRRLEQAYQSLKY